VVTATLLAFCAAAATATALGTWIFRAFAVRRGIVANPNFRSLHERPIPRGGGIVLGIVCVTGLALMWGIAGVNPSLTLVLVAGGLAATTFGLVDDSVQVPALLKLSVQSALAAGILWALGPKGIHDLPLTPVFVDVFLSWLGLVWLMNAYNFIDGIDGLAASGAVLISGLAVVALVLTGADGGLRLVFGAVAACSLGFLCFNWPPATIFMGDAGSLFLGFCVATLLTSTVTSGQIGIWTWLVILAFFIGDTTTTTVLRIFMTDRWYGEHRSHGYQNLARLHSHSKVLQGVLIYHFAWLLPLTIWSVLRPATAPLVALMAIGPVVLWTFRYGPRLSSS
jgi:Fuc2NAc and GlcNAc transferase